VQELALDSENLPPNNYIYDEGGAGFRDALPFSESDLHVSVIDIGKLTSPSTAQHELHKLQSALHSCGFFMVSFSLFIYIHAAYIFQITTFISVMYVFLNNPTFSITLKFHKLNKIRQKNK